MNKTELIAAVANKTGITKKDAGDVLNAFLDAIKDAMASGDKVQLIGFGTFEAKERAARTARNPRTGTEIEVPAAKAPTFKAGKELKDSINK
ncbi:MAG: HU family DNA-binding protein [Clostridia bacterium]|nr:HU family DNA-binding protein [Clostridia bacterium]